MLQGEGLDLTVCTRVLRLFLGGLNPDKVKHEDRVKVLQVVQPCHQAQRLLALADGRPATV